ncbi:MAG: glutathione S-transferase family protein [Bacteriovorax sp.]
MITLYQFPRSKNFPNMSPFCVKLETYLLMADIPYETKFTISTKSSPKGKMPYIEFKKGAQTEVISDSSFIIEKLIKEFGDKTDTHLTETDRAIKIAIQRLCEDNLLYAMVYFRWIDEQGWPEFKDMLFAQVPFPLRAIVPVIVQKKVLKKLRGQGITDHTREEIIHIARQNLKALSDLLGSKPFFFGEQPTIADAIVFGLVGNIRFETINTPLKNVLSEFPNLEQFSDRMKQRFFAN